MIEFKNIECSLSSYTTLSKFWKKIISSWLNSVIIEEWAMTENKNLGNIVYVFCNDNYLLNKNIKYLNHDYLTDVITFDYSEDILISGDVLISLERVYENANTFEVSFTNELERVMVHGLLHLIGYNDTTKQEKEEIRKKEDYYLELLKLYKKINI